MYCFYKENGKLLTLYRGFSKHSNFLFSQLDQTGLSVPILDRDPHQSSNTGSHRLVICQYSVGTWNTERGCIKNIFSHRIWCHSKILFVPTPFRFLGNKVKTFIKLNPATVDTRALCRVKYRSCYNSHTGRKKVASYQRIKVSLSFRMQ